MEKFIYILIILIIFNGNIFTESLETGEVVQLKVNKFLAFGRTDPQKSFVSFVGIRYGNLNRFEKATLNRLPQGPLDATQFGSICIQAPLMVGGHHHSNVSEHCLFLNVWIPKTHFQKLAHPNPPLLPIMVYIHGGAFAIGSGAPKHIEPSVYTDQGLIYVALNYRLNLHGFLSHEQIAPNVGLLDQRLALEWIQEYIAYFGGDREKVTLIGDSAGAISILHQLTYQQKPSSKPSNYNNMSQKLFHAAIIISPGLFAGSEYSIPKTRLQSQKIANQLGCYDNSSPKSIFECLMSLKDTELRIPASRLSSPFISTIPAELKINGFPFDDGENYPDLIEALDQGWFDKEIPVIIGSDWSEGSMFANMPFTIIPPTNELYEDMVYLTFGKEKGSVLLDRYSVQKYGSPLEAMFELSSHVFTSQGTCIASRLLSLNSYSPIYRYGNYHLLSGSPPESKMGAFHTSMFALMLTTSRPTYVYPTEFNEAERSMALQLRQLFADFAKNNGNLSKSSWPVFNTTSFHELHIGPDQSSKISIGTSFQREDCEFWMKLYPPYGLAPPLFYGNVYKSEALHAFILNEGVWFVLIHWKTISIILAGMILLCLAGLLRKRKWIGKVEKKESSKGLKQKKE